MEMPSPVPGEEQPQAPGQAGANLLGSSFAEEALRVPVDTKLMSPCSKGRQPPGLPEAENLLQVEGDGPSPLLRPGETHLECWIRCWAPQYKRDVDLLERVQQRATTTIKGLEHLTCEERLKGPGLFSLEETRLQGLLNNMHLIARWTKMLKPDSFLWLPETMGTN